MSSEMFLSIGGTIIVGLFLIVGYFASKALSKIDIVANDVTKLLTVHGITDEKLKTHEQQINFLVAKQIDNSDKWAELYKEYNMNSIRHK